MDADSRHVFNAAFVHQVLTALKAPVAEQEPHEIILRPEHSNEVAEVHYPDGRVLMVKRARYPGMAVQFIVDRVAAPLFRNSAGVLAPEYLEVSHAEEAVEEALLVYWRIAHPTLAELWPALSDEARPELLRDWGRMMRRIHQVRLPGHGPLLEAMEGGHPLREFLQSDLEQRLIPASRAVWPAAVPVMDELLRALPQAIPAGMTRGAVLLHNDLFSENVLCEQQKDEIRCVGILDLEDSFSGPPEAELAKTEILHGPLFRHPWPGDWFDRILEGYATPYDPLLIGIFRAYHLLNMGYHGAAAGYAAHAEDVARVVTYEVQALGRDCRHAQVAAAQHAG